MKTLRAAFLALALAAGSLSAWAQDITVDFWQDFEFTTLDATNLAANDHITGGTWTPHGTRLSTTTSAEKISTGLISGNSDSGGTRGLRYQGTADFQSAYIEYEFPSNPASGSFGFWFRFPAAFVGSLVSGNPDLIRVRNVLGTDEFYIKLQDNNQAEIILFTPESGDSSPILLEPDTWYWLTGLYDTTHRLRAYDETGAQVGSEVTLTGAGGANQEITTFELGAIIGDETGSWGPYDFDDVVFDLTDATFPLGPPLATGTTDQEGFRWGVDDGNEASHTFEAAQDTNISIADDQSRLLRVLVDGTDDPDSAAYTLYAQKNGTGGYSAVAVGSSSKVTPVIEAADATVGGNNTASTSWAVSHPAASTGDLLIFCIAWDDSASTTDVTEPSGPNGETLSEINATPATDAATETRSKCWYTVATGSWSASSRTFTPAASEQWSAAVVRVPAGEFDGATPIGGSGVNTTAGTTDTNVLNAAFTAGASDGSGRLLSFSSIDVDPVTVASGWSSISSGAGADIGAVAHGLFSRNTAVTNSESITAGTTGTIASDSWASVSFVVRAPTVTNEVYVTTSANIAAGGEATTARLTAPSGKTTGDADTGRRWDDENGSDSIDITTDNYIEVEWLVYIAASASASDYYDFRVYAGSNALDTYTVTPRWTIPSGASGLLLRRRRAALEVANDPVFQLAANF